MIDHDAYQRQLWLDASRYRYLRRKDATLWNPETLWLEELDKAVDKAIEDDLARHMSGTNSMGWANNE